MDGLIASLHRYLEESDLLQHVPIAGKPQLSYLAQGEYNRNFILEDENNRYVLRVNYGSQIATDNQIEYEHATLAALAESGVTPRPLFVDGSQQLFPQGILVMEYIPGRPLDYATDLDDAAAIFARIHAVTPPEPNHFIHETRLFSDRVDEAHHWLKDTWESPALDAGIKRILEQAVAACDKGRQAERYFVDNPLLCINNTEVNSHNFVIGDDRSTLVDWEKAVVTDPCQDLTHFIALTTTQWKAHTTLSAEQEKRFLDQYTAKLPAFADKHIDERVRLYKPYLNLRAISWCAFAYVDYQRPDRDIANPDTYKKMQQYLEPAFLNALFADILT